MYLLSKEIVFPPVQYANSDGILAIGGDLSAERLQLAYKSGIFPWFCEGDPIIWYSPDPRMVLFFNKLKVSKSMKQLIKSQKYIVTFNQNFEAVIANCKTIVREGQSDTWITEDMKNAYINLHKIGVAKSVEVWKQDSFHNKELVGGLYGIDLGHVFCGESMFSKESNTSKLAFIYLAQKLEKENYKLIDCQVHNDHLESLGAIEIPRNDFLKYLNNE